MFLYTCIRQWQPTPVLLPGKSHGWRSLVGCSPWGCKESDTTERLPFHFSLSRIGEGNGNPLQCSCLENSRDRGAWWAANYGVAQSRKLLKQLSSSSSSSTEVTNRGEKTTRRVWQFQWGRTWLMWLLILCFTLAGPWYPDMNWKLFWMFLWGHFWVRLTFKPVDFE